MTDGIELHQPTKSEWPSRHEKVTMAITTATSTRDMVERRDTAVCMEPEVSITS
jgi:hypothetical protein